MNPQMIVAAIWAVSLVVVGIWQNSAGHTDCELTYTKQESVDLIAANEKITELTNKRISDNTEHATRLSLLSQQYEKEKQDESKKRDRVITDLRAERIRLRDPGSTSPTSNPGNGITAPTGKCDGEARGFLSNETAEFLVSLTGEADEVVHQLTECQAVVMSDRGMTAKQTEGEGNEQ
jgi:FtsZ-interacting cell division protein ZipA